MSQYLAVIWLLTEKLDESNQSGVQRVTLKRDLRENLLNTGEMEKTEIYQLSTVLDLSDAKQRGFREDEIKKMRSQSQSRNSTLQPIKDEVVDHLEVGQAAEE